MENLLNEKPTTEDHRGRLFQTLHFVDPADITGKRVLDIGCGYGWYELHLVQHGVAQACGIEPTEKDLYTAKQHVRLPQVDFTVGTAIAIPYPDEHFDTVVS